MSVSEVDTTTAWGTFELSYEVESQFRKNGYLQLTMTSTGPEHPNRIILQSVQSGLWLDILLQFRAQCM